MSPLSRPMARPAVAVLATAFAALAINSPADAAPAKTKARPDSVTIQAGGPKVAVSVLANDTIAGDRNKVRISFVEGSTVSETSGRVRQQRKTIVFSAPLSTAPKTATLLYKVTDSLGHSTKGVITLTVTAADPG